MATPILSSLLLAGLLSTSAVFAIGCQLYIEQDEPDVTGPVPPRSSGSSSDAGYTPRDAQSCIAHDTCPDEHQCLPSGTCEPLAWCIAPEPEPGTHDVCTEYAADTCDTLRCTWCGDHCISEELGNPGGTCPDIVRSECPSGFSCDHRTLCVPEF